MSLDKRITALEQRNPVTDDTVTIVRQIIRPAQEGEDGPQLMGEIVKGPYPVIPRGKGTQKR